MFWTSLSVCAAKTFSKHDLFSYGSLEERIPADHPLRPVRAMVDDALKGLDAPFDEIYGEDGRRSIPPERREVAALRQLNAQGQNGRVSIARTS